MKLAYFSPLHPAPSGISDYSEELLPSLAAQFGASAELTLVVDGYKPTNPEIAKHFRVLDDREYAARDFELALYQLGNSPAHAYIYQRALREPGVIVLHDLVLHHLIAWMTLNRGDRAGYIQAMRDAYGERGAELAEREALGLEALNRFDYPLSERVIRASRAVIAHSRYVANAAQNIAPHVPIAIIPHEMPNTAVISQRDARTRLQLPQDAMLLGSFGNLGPTKRTTVLLEAFHALRKNFPNARLLLVGAASPNFDVANLLDVFDVRDAVDVIGYVPFDEFHAYMAAMDVCVNLRYPTAGETSGAVLRMMAQAKAVIVSRVGWFAELPDDAVAKIDVDDTETELLRVVLERLLQDQPLRATMGTNARRYIEQECAVQDAARAYADFLRAVNEGRAVSKNYFKPNENAASSRRAQAIDAPRDDASRQMANNTRVPSASPAETGGDTVHEQTSAVASDWRDDVARAYAELGFQEDDPLLREIAQQIVELDLND